LTVELEYSPLARFKLAALLLPLLLLVLVVVVVLLCPLAALAPGFEALPPLLALSQRPLVVIDAAASASPLLAPGVLVPTAIPLLCG